MLPLHNITVLVTRPTHQSEEFIAKLNQLGANVVHVPLIATAPINTEKLKTVFQRQAFDWLVFTSTNAVSYFFDSIPANTINCKIAVVGKNTQEAVSAKGLPVSFIPSAYNALTLADEIPIQAGEQFFIPRSNLSKNNYVTALENKGGKVFPLSIYQNQALTYTKEEVDRFFSKKIDYITFTSGSTIEAFCKLKINTAAKIVCIGPSTANTANEHNLFVDAVAQPSTTDGIIKALLELTKG